jgi:hypothetical protein
MSQQRTAKRPRAVTALLTVLFAAAGAAFSWAMPARVMIIRHAEKYEDRQKIHLNPQGLTRAQALVQLFQSDPRVLEHGRPAAIVAQRPSVTKKSVRCEETVAPLARALGKKVINRFAYGETTQLADWLRSTRQWDSKSVLICAAHLDIAPIAKALGVTYVGQTVWPHETYDRVWVIDFSPKDGKPTAFRNIPQSLLFGDTFEQTSSDRAPGMIDFSQTYSETFELEQPEGRPTPVWKCEAKVEIKGDFSRFDDDTIPALRLGGFTFGYYATTLGKLRAHKDAEVNTDAEAGSGSLRYDYKALVDGVERTYARVSFSWDKERLKGEFQAEVDEGKIMSPEICKPVELYPQRSEGFITGVTSCYAAFGGKRFYAPAGLPYEGEARKTKDGTDREVYEANLSTKNGIVLEKGSLPEL